MTTKRYSVHWTDVAEADLEGVILQLAHTANPDLALSKLAQVRKKAERLKTLPGRGRVVPELREFGVTGVRELVIERWRLLYRISKRRVYVLAFVDSSRDFADALLDRFLVGASAV